MRGWLAPTKVTMIVSRFGYQFYSFENLVMFATFWKSFPHLSASCGYKSSNHSSISKVQLRHKDRFMGMKIVKDKTHKDLLLYRI